MAVAAPERRSSAEIPPHELADELTPEIPAARVADELTRELPNDDPAAA